MLSFEEYKVVAAPDSVFYVPDFISESEEKSLLDQISRTPGPRWTQLSNRRLQNWGGVPHPRGMIAETLPAWLQTYVDRVNDSGVFDNNCDDKPVRANHVLLNEYLPGKKKDGCHDRYPLIV